MPIQLPPPSKEWERNLSDPADPLRRSRVSFVGSPGPVSAQMRDFVERTQADELIASQPRAGGVLVVPTLSLTRSPGGELAPVLALGGTF